MVEKCAERKVFNAVRRKGLRTRTAVRSAKIRKRSHSEGIGERVKTWNNRRDFRGATIFETYEFQ